jgi:hypothetical protein
MRGRKDVRSSERRDRNSRRREVTRRAERLSMTRVRLFVLFLMKETQKEKIKNE